MSNRDTTQLRHWFFKSWKEILPKAVLVDNLNSGDKLEKNTSTPYVKKKVNDKDTVTVS